MASSLRNLESDQANLLKQKTAKLEQIKSLKKENKDISLQERELADINRLIEYVEERIEAKKNVN